MRRALAFAFVLTVASPALAAPTEGERLFREGRAAMTAQDYATACTKFAESEKAEPAPGTLLNLGDCEEHRGHFLAAKDAYMLAAVAYTTADKKQYATQRGDAMEQRIPRLVLRASVLITGLTAKAGTFAVPIGTETKMDPGDVTITASAPGKRDKVLHIALKESRTTELDIGPLDDDRPVAVTPPPADKPVTVTTTTRPGSGKRTLGFVVGGVGIAAIGVGAVTGIMTLGRASTVKDHCTGDLACDPEGLDAANSGATLSLVSTIAFAAGVLGLGIGTYLVLTSPRGTTTALVPAASDHEASLVLRSTF